MCAAQSPALSPLGSGNLAASSFLITAIEPTVFPLGRSYSGLGPPCVATEQPAHRIQALHPGLSWAASTCCDLSRSLLENTLLRDDGGEMPDTHKMGIRYGACRVS